MTETRTFSPITREDLEELWRRSEIELERWLYQSGSPRGRYAVYSNRFLFATLAQGAAQHFAETQAGWEPDQTVEVPEAEIQERGLRVGPDGLVLSGVKDLDVVFFFEELSSRPIPRRKHCRLSREHGFPGLGVRRVDWMKKGIAAPVLNAASNRSPREIARAYLRDTRHGQYLSKKALVGLQPDNIRGHVLWSSRRLTSVRS